MKVFQTPDKGFCFGVKRSIDIAFKTIKTAKVPVYTYGPIIHNPQVVKQLAEQGITPIESLEGVKPGKLILRSHGAPPSAVKEAEKLGFSVVDAVCPFVRRAQNYAKKLYKEKYKVIIIGEQEHPEIKGILGHAGMRTQVINHSTSIEELPDFKKLGIVAQTTLPVQRFVEVITKLLPKAEEVLVYNTLCKDVILRQQHTAKLAKSVDVMIVIGGKNSANTRRLAELAKQEGCKTYHIETYKNLEPKWFENKSRVGITSGASTPDWIIEEIVKTIKSYRGGKNEKR